MKQWQFNVLLSLAVVLVLALFTYGTIANENRIESNRVAYFVQMCNENENLNIYYNYQVKVFEATCTNPITKEQRIYR